MKKQSSLEIKVARQVGYCYGVERALNLAFKATDSHPRPIFTLGPIIHNPQVVESLAREEIYPVSSLEEVKEGTLIIRSHGVNPSVIAEAKKRGIAIVDATCPFVKKAQQVAAALAAEGYYVVIVGERNHPEVLSILGHAGDKAQAVEAEDDLSALPPETRRIGVVVQTTQPIEKLEEIVKLLLRQALELKVHNTICHATTQRQKEAESLTREVDLMLVVGGKNSANTNRLVQICRAKGVPTYHIETAAEINSAWFKKGNKVGVTTGTSTPQWILKEVIKSLEQIARAKLEKSKTKKEAISD